MADSTVRGWIERGHLPADASPEEIRAYADRPPKPKPVPPPEPPRPLPPELREQVERGTLRVFTPRTAEERARYGLPPVEHGAA